MKIIMYNSKIILKVKVIKVLILGLGFWKFEVFKFIFYNFEVIGVVFFFKFWRFFNKIDINSKKNYIRKKIFVYVNCING